MKQEVPLKHSLRLVNNGPVVLVTSRYEGKDNIITIAWCSPVSHEPPALAIAVKKTRFSYGLIKGAGAFVVNIPDIKLLDKVIFCGKHSGSEVDKFATCGFSKSPAKYVDVPMIGECVANIECKVMKDMDCDSHTIFVGKILYAVVEAEVFTDHWLLDKVTLIHHLGDKYYEKSGIPIIT